MEFHREALEIVLAAGRELTGRRGADHIKEKRAHRLCDGGGCAGAAVHFPGALKDRPGRPVPGGGEGQQRRGHEWPGVDPDPVDGTTNFIHDFQHSVVSLACSERGRITSGIVYDPYRRECFEAQEGWGAFLNKRPVSVSKAAELSQCLIAVGTSPGHRERADESFRKMRAVYDRCQDIRRVGSAALELCYVACGRLDGFFEERLKLWDYGAAGLILREAGGWIQADERQVAAGTPGIREELLGLVGDETDKKLYSSDREGM